MNVKYLKKVGFGHKFLLQDTRYDVVNGIRRLISGSVKTLAIDSVKVYKNESAMPDEFLAHRLGLVPVLADDFDDNSEYSLYLKKTGGLVKSGDIETDGNVDIPCQNIPLVKLNDNKTVELELVVKPGCGKDHVKWSPALVYYNNVPTLKQNKPVDKEIISLCPKNCLEIKANKVVLNDIYNCDICKYCEVATEGKIEIVLDENNFILTIEPYGNLSLSNIIKGLDKSFTNDIDELYDQISKLK